MIFCFPPLFLRAYMILLGSPGIIPLLEGLMLITPAKRPALCQAPCSRVLSTEVWISLGGGVLLPRQMGIALCSAHSPRGTGEHGLGSGVPAAFCGFSSTPW